MATRISSRVAITITLSLVIVGALYVIEQFIGASYVVKTALKVLLFLILPLGLAFAYEQKRISKILGLENFTVQSLLPGLLLGVGSFLIILGAYAILGSFIDMEAIADNLESKLGINSGNFLFVGLYVIFVNSLLEEFFFRGFLFLNLKGHASRVFAYVFSAGLFAVYHLAIIKGWFNPVLMALALISLFVIGLVFNYLNSRSGHFLNSWLAHGIADSAIILIGMHMFGIL
ncbi:MAG: hypothetical protein AB199_03635 [Parcubacteria bacterium C7867-004]|nr:MAG: hypothetical protein AB199_03635 [Parcubacteria bacterium C7867-004]